MELINVVCLKWGTLYSADYVNKLYNAVSRHSTVPFNFHCFTDDQTGIDPDVNIVELPDNKLSGWWNKLYLFSADLPISGRMLFIDLDTLIVGNIDDVLSIDYGFIALRDFFFGIANGVTATSVGSGLMSFDIGAHRHVWDKFIKDPAGTIGRCHPHGDQRFIQQEISDVIFWQDLLPGKITSFKVHCREGLPDGTSIVCYHGKPNIPESITEYTNVQQFKITPQPWVADHWR